jgi:putative transposase
MRKTYPTSLSDQEWACLKPHLPASKPLGRLRTHTLRDVFDGIFYILRSGYPWRLLPHDFPPWPTVYYPFRKFRLSGVWHLVFKALHTAERKRVGKNPDASAAIIESQSVKTTEEGARSNGYDVHKNIKGRKRYILVDTLGLPLSVYVIPTNVHDRVGARHLLAGLGLLVPHPKKIWADAASGGEEFASWCEEQGGWALEIAERNTQTKGFKVLPKRWIVERTFSWLIRNRRLRVRATSAGGADKRNPRQGDRDPPYI